MVVGCERPWLPVCLVIGALVFLSALPAVARGAVGVAVWSPGDSWEWRSLNFPGQPVVTILVLGEETLGVSVSSYSVYHARVWNNFTQTSPYSNMSGDVWYRSSDLAALKSVLIFAGSANGTLPYTLTMTSSSPFSLHFPLIENDTWTATTTVTIETALVGQPATWQNVSMTTTASVGAPYESTVAAGTFVTTPIWVTIPGEHAGMLYWSSDVGNGINGAFFGPAWFFSLADMQLVAYHHTPPSLSTASPLSNPVVLLGVGAAVGAVLGAAAVVLVSRRARRRADGVGPDQESDTEGPRQ